MESCLFCRIVSGDIASDRIYEDGNVVVFRDIHPVAPVHVLIVPKVHFADILEMVRSDEGRALLDKLSETLPAIVEAAGLKDRGFRLVNNCGVDGGQTVPHVHFHLIGGKPLGPKL